MVSNKVFYSGKMSGFVRFILCFFRMTHKYRSIYPMSVLLIVLYTWTMLLHQKNAVTTSKPVYRISCYHIKMTHLMRCFVRNFFYKNYSIFYQACPTVLALFLNVPYGDKTWHKERLVLFPLKNIRKNLNGY